MRSCERVSTLLSFFVFLHHHHQPKKKHERKQDGLRYRLPDPTLCDDTSQAPGIYATENMWSPRRNHRAVTIDERMFVLGGRAREIADISRDRTVGGVLDPRIETDPFYSTWREPSVLKNDVWASDDEGGTWTLVNPGCHAPQIEDVLAGNEENGKAGVPANECSEDDDCYGVGVCRDVGGTGRHTTCVCPMWSPRELHAAAVHDGNIYVVGGFVSVRRSNCGDYACGDVDAGAYRGYKSDVWLSSDGATWTAITREAGWPGRGDHGLFVYSGAMYVAGGAADGGDGRVSFMDDVWRAYLPERCVGVIAFLPSCLPASLSCGVRAGCLGVVLPFWVFCYALPCKTVVLSYIHTSSQRGD